MARKNRLSWYERTLVAHASLLLPLVEVWMRRRGFPRCRDTLLRIARRLPSRGSRPADPAPQARRTAFLVEHANRRYALYPADCLARSVVLQYFLTRMRLPCELRVGVRTLTGRFEAHSWIEYAGEPLNEKEPVRGIYCRFDQALEPSVTNQR